MVIARRGISAMVLIAVVCAATAVAAAEDAPVPRGMRLERSPGFGLMQPGPSATAFMSLPVSIVSTGSDLTFRADRSGSDAVRLRLDGSPWRHTVHLAGADLAEGLPGALHVRLSKRSGTYVGDYSLSACPNAAWEPDLVLVSCGYLALTRSLVTRFTAKSGGFIRGLAHALAGSPALPPAGPYVAAITFDPMRHFPDGRRSDNSLSIDMTVRPSDPVGTSQSPSAGPAAPRALPAARRADRFPDLVPAAPQQLQVETRGKRRALRFDSLFWNASGAPLVLRGTRTRRSAMAVEQVIEGRSSRPSGRFIFDPRDGHDHWHFLSAARYELVTTAGHVVRTSGKVGFCIGDSTPIDQSLPRSAKTGDSDSLCDGRGRRRLQMHLSPGWGDLYLQNLPGQAFDVTNLQPGVYAVRVTVNPTRSLAERSYGNNRVLRWLRLSNAGLTLRADWLARRARWSSPGRSPAR